MENISLKSLVSQKTINEAEIDRLLQEDFDREVSILQENRNVYSNANKHGVLTESELDEGWLDTLKHGAKDAWNDLTARYKKAKAAGDQDEIDRTEKKLIAMKEKLAASRGTSTTPPVSEPTAGSLSSTPVKDNSENDKLAALYTSKTPPAPVTQSPDTASANPDAEDVTPHAEKKSPIEKKYAMRLGNSIVKKLLKSTPNAVTPNTIGSIIKDPVKLNKQLDASVNIGRRLKSIIAKNYSGDIKAYIQKNNVSSSQDALALLDIIRVLAGIKHKDRTQFISSIFNGSEEVKRAITTTTAPTAPTKVPATSTIKKKTKTANTSPIVNTDPVPTAPSRGTNARTSPSRVGRGGTTASRNVKSRTENCESSTINGKLLEESIDTNSNDSKKLFTRSTSIPNMFRLS